MEVHGSPAPHWIVDKIIPGSIPDPIIVALTFQGKGMMSWSRLYGVKNYLKSSLWLVPFVAIPLELVITRFLHRLDAWLGWTLLGFTQIGARALLEAFATITLSLRLPADSYSGCQRAADPATDRNDAVAQSRRQIHRRALHIYIDVCAQRTEPHG